MLLKIFAVLVLALAAYTKYLLNHTTLGRMDELFMFLVPHVRTELWVPWALLLGELAVCKVRSRAHIKCPLDQPQTPRVGHSGEVGLSEHGGGYVGGSGG